MLLDIFLIEILLNKEQHLKVFIMLLLEAWNPSGVCVYVWTLELMIEPPSTGITSTHHHAQIYLHNFLGIKFSDPHHFTPWAIIPALH